MNNNIQEQLVSFEVAKLLKEAGFKCWCKYKLTDFNGIERLEENASELFPYVPTQQIVIDWLRINFNINISVDFDGKTWFEIITILPQGDRECGGEYKSPEEAKEAAILYTLQNLIK